jgi:hypothetical protein
MPSAGMVSQRSRAADRCRSPTQNSVPWLSRFTAVSHHCSLTSIPMALRPQFRAATRVVPEPMNGSRTRHPSRVAVCTIRSRRASGFSAGCSVVLHCPASHFARIRSGADRSRISHSGIADMRIISQVGRSAFLYAGPIHSLSQTTQDVGDSPASRKAFVYVGIDRQLPNTQIDPSLLVALLQSLSHCEYQRATFMMSPHDPALLHSVPVE